MASIASQGAVKGCTPALNRPVYGSRSYAEAASLVKDQENVAFKPELTTVSRGKVDKATRLEFRRAKESVSESDLQYYLTLKFAFVPRDKNILRAMVLKAEVYLKSYDLTGMSSEEVYKMVMRVVRSAIAIPKDEELVRASLKNSDVLEVINKHHKLVSKGIIGHVGNLTGKTSLSLPDQA
jgi:hypothetical protein